MSERDIMSSDHLSQGTGLWLAGWSWLCGAEALQIASRVRSGFHQNFPKADATALRKKEADAYAKESSEDRLGLLVMFAFLVGHSVSFSMLVELLD